MSFTRILFSVANCYRALAIYIHKLRADKNRIFVLFKIVEIVPGEFSTTSLSR